MTLVIPFDYRELAAEIIKQLLPARMAPPPYSDTRDDRNAQIIRREYDRNGDVIDTNRQAERRNSRNQSPNRRFDDRLDIKVTTEAKKTTLYPVTIETAAITTEANETLVIKNAIPAIEMIIEIIDDRNLSKSHQD